MLGEVSRNLIWMTTIARKKEPTKKLTRILNFQPQIRVLVNAISVFECDVHLNLSSETLLWFQPRTSSQLDLNSFLADYFLHC